MGAVATHAINPTLYASIPYDPVKDFQPVTQIASTPERAGGEFLAPCS